MLVQVAPAWVERIRAGLPELPEARRRRYVERFGLPEHDAVVLTSTRAMAEFFERTVAVFPTPKAVSNWLIGDVAAYLNAQGREIDEVPIRPEHLAGLLTLIDAGQGSGRSA